MKSKGPVLVLPDGMSAALQLAPEELVGTIRLMAALKLFELGRLSSGKAAELAGISRIDFIDACGQYGVSVFNYPDDQVEAELQADLQALREARS